jgi:hypothetical protein
MRDIDLEQMTVPQLVSRFAELALGQFDAELHGQIAKYNRLYDQIVAVEQELKRRPGDERSALIPLFAHPNPQVRLMAAEWALAVAPAAARQALQDISDRNEYPQAAYARDTLMSLEEGTRKPT